MRRVHLFSADADVRWAISDGLDPDDLITTSALIDQIDAKYGLGCPPVVPHTGPGPGDQSGGVLRGNGGCHTAGNGWLPPHDAADPRSLARRYVKPRDRRDRQRARGDGLGPSLMTLADERRGLIDERRREGGVRWC